MIKSISKKKPLTVKANKEIKPKDIKANIVVQANKVPVPSKDTLEAQAEQNTTVVERADKIDHTSKQGTPLDHANKHFKNQIGLSLGITKNMENYQSLRVDCWLSVNYDGQTDPQQIYDKLSDVLSERLEIEVNKVLSAE